MKGEIDFDQTLNRQQSIWSVWQDLAFGNSLLGGIRGLLLLERVLIVKLTPGCPGVRIQI